MNYMVLVLQVRAMTTATVVLGVSVGAAFALIVLVLVVAYCIYTHKNPERRHGGTRKVRPINFVELSKNLSLSLSLSLSFCNTISSKGSEYNYSV